MTLALAYWMETSIKLAVTLVVIPTVYRMLSFGRGPLPDPASPEAAA